MRAIYSYHSSKCAMIFICIHFSLRQRVSQTVKAFLDYPASCSRVWQDLFIGGLGGGFFVPRGARDSPTPGKPVTDREKLGMGGQCQGLQQNPVSWQAPPLWPLSRVLPRCPRGGSSARGAERKLTRVLLLRCCLRGKSATTDFCHDSLLFWFS